MMKSLESKDLKGLKYAKCKNIESREDKLFLKGLIIGFFFGIVTSFVTGSHMGTYERCR